MQQPHTIQDLADLIIYYLNFAIPMLVLIAVVVYFGGTAWGIFNLSSGHAKPEDQRNNALWGIAIIFVMVSIWGIIRLLQSTLF